MSDPRRFIEYETPGPQERLGRLMRSAELLLERTEERAEELRRAGTPARRQRRPARGCRLWPRAAAAVVAAAVALWVGLVLRGAPPEPGGAELAAVSQARIEAPADEGARWTEMVIQGLGSFERESARNLVVEERSEARRIVVEEGYFRAQVDSQPIDRPLILDTPHLRVVVVGTRFDLFVTPARTDVLLIEGRVRIESPFGQLYLSAGESISSDDPRLAPRERPASAIDEAAGPIAGVERVRARASSRAAHQGAPATRARVSASASAARVANPSELHRSAAGHLSPDAPRAGVEPLREPLLPARARDCILRSTEEAVRACLARLAKGDGLSAQSALYLLGKRLGVDPERYAEAIETFRSLQERFPRAVYLPEASLEIFELQRARGAVAEAIATAAQFELRFLDDPRVPEVKLARARLICNSEEERLRDPEQLARLFGELHALSNLGLRFEAVRLEESCGR